MTSFNEVFERVKDYCAKSGSIGETAHKLWIQSLEPVELQENTAVFYVQSEFQKGIVLKNYEKLLKEAFFAVLGFEVDIQINTQDDIKKDEPKPEEDAQSKHLELEKSFENAEYEYTFDTFIVGRSNEFAYAACTAVANNRSSAYNPLFIHGPSGLGKTHLLTAISHEIKKKNPQSNIIYVSGDSFTNELITAIRTETTAQFHTKYRSADVLLVDDVQFIAGKESTQEEFFHTFNELHKVGKQIVLTSDRPPKDIKTLEERIRTRFEWGLIADISTPDFETRIAIIKRKAELLQLTIPDEVAEFIANRLKTNIRQLEGAVKKLKALKHLAGSPPSMAMAQSVIRDILNDNQPVPVTVERIIGEVAGIYGVTADDIRSNKRSSQISTARKVAIYVVREITEMPLSAIGTEFGGRDHSTIVYAIANVEESLKKDAHLKEIVEDLIKNIREK
ncbi:MAG: chromosomal replication initiator protein [Clostridiales bacterium]|jgi:chromosomal replication initiator protein|nr:chromosomal replication initiator protein DnaA [Oscillospiraceae bacterium]MDN5378332.1 chromosomal replication initiator protein [Clostridiales bacterium]